MSCVTRRTKDGRYYEAQDAEHFRAELNKFVYDVCGNQTKAAKVLGVDQSTVSRALDVTKQPSLRILIALARHQNRSTDDLLGLQTTVKQGHLTEQDVDRIAAAVSSQITRTSAPPVTTEVRRKGAK